VSPAVTSAVPTDTEMVSSTPTPPGGLLVRSTSGELMVDDPTVGDVYARYCVECGTGPGGEKTIILEYNSADGMIETGYFYLTGVEELQVGLGDGAKVYALDSAAGPLVESDYATVSTATKIELVQNLLGDARMAVVVDDGKIVGVITKIDLIDYLARRAV